MLGEQGSSTMRVLDVFSKKATVMLGLSFALAALPATEAEAQTACHNQTDTLRVYGCKPKAHVVMDAQSGQILMAHEPQRRVQPASTTKIMTMMLAFDAIREGRLQVDQTLTFSANAARQPATNLNIRAGERITLDLALKALAVHSANDAATLIAETVAGSEDAFAAMMNAKARALGMNNTHFVNASGWEHRDQYSTAHDLALLAQAHLRDYSEFAHYFSTKQFTHRGRVFQTSSNILEGAIDRRTARPSGIEGVFWMKGGWFRNAGSQAVTAYRNGERDYVIVTTGNENRWARRDRVEGLIRDLKRQVPSNIVTTGASFSPS